MPTGTAKFFNQEKGFGFIQPDNGGDDVFVHISGLQSSGLQTLTKDQRVEYEVVQDFKNGKLKAERIKLLAK